MGGGVGALVFCVRIRTWPKCVWVGPFYGNSGCQQALLLSRQSSLGRRLLGGCFGTFSDRPPQRTRLLTASVGADGSLAHVVSSSFSASVDRSTDSQVSSTVYSVIV